MSEQEQVVLPVEEDQEVEELRRQRRGATAPRNWRPEEYPASAQPLDMAAAQAPGAGAMPRFRAVNTVEEGPDPSEIKIMRDRHKKTIPNWLFFTIIGVIGLGFPLMIFISFMQSK